MLDHRVQALHGRKRKELKVFQKKIIHGCEERGDYGSPYLTRYTLLDIKNFQLCLHIFHRSDAEDLHDHPWPFISLILWRGYVEVTPKGRSRKWPLMMLFRNATHSHRVELVGNKKSVSLVLMGKRKREWGFFTKEGWTQWQKYYTDKGCW